MTTIDLVGEFKHAGIPFSIVKVEATLPERLRDTPSEFANKVTIGTENTNQAEKLECLAIALRRVTNKARLAVWHFRWLNGFEPEIRESGGGGT